MLKFFAKLFFKKAEKAEKAGKSVKGDDKTMRRSELEVTDKTKINSIIGNCTCCRLGLYDGERVYVVPMNFGTGEEDGKLTLYFHSAKTGKKVDILKTSPNIGFEMDTNYKLCPGTAPHECTSQYQSVIGTGTVCFISDTAQKTSAVNAIMLHNTGKQGYEFPEKLLERTLIFKLTVDELSCKEHTAPI